MKLQNLLPHMANGSVLVNGHHYELDAHGVTKQEVLAVDAQKLLANRAAWKAVVERQAVVAETMIGAPAKAPGETLSAPASTPPAPPEVKPVLGKPGKKR